MKTNSDSILSESYPMIIWRDNTADRNEVTFDMKENALNDVSEKFIAVSYCWGDESPTEHLPLSNGDYLKVTSSVVLLIQHVAGVASGLPIWIDAICINQADLEEKSTQVSMMGNIYSRAECVLIWLGSKGFTQDDELSLWSYIKSSLKFENTPFSSARGIVEDGAGDAVLGRVLQSRWFERVWVVQEMCLARKIFFLCGAIGMSLPFLQHYMETRRKNYTNIPDSYSNSSDWGQTGLSAFKRLRKLYKSRNLIQEHSGRPVVTLPDTLFDYQACKSTDPRDKVFALLGLAAYHQFQPDYSLSKEDTFIQAMIACAPFLDDYRILVYAGLANPRFYQETAATNLAMVPTWVPDFSCHFLTAPFAKHPDFKATLPRDLNELLREFARSGNKDVVKLGLTNDLCLRIQIHSVDVIEDMTMDGLCPIGSSSSIEREVSKRRYDISREGIRMLEEGGSVEPASHICRETMTAGGLNGDISQAERATIFKDFQNSEDTGEHLSQSQRDNRILNFYTQMHLSGIGRSRKLFITSRGHFGMANNGVSKDDLACLISGAPVPFVLRKRTASSGDYEVYNLYVFVWRMSLSRRLGPCCPKRY
ncbi:HET-domain-containing protein [Bimuria novae-zelandiae CBS 107.79]|uniref:HET-domain-containing protein n=1 Tax=Bimuria novae-zelandiae CBS 107.79 TaxID=1447943 RepID=A0A6A5VYA1_9PLEO|nr:HET-domain-containing protein [Bimuria novae-zelandiae CBS 107.79]